MLGVYDFFKKMIDAILGPPIKFLKLARSKLEEANMITAQGLDVGSYLSIFGDLPKVWQMCINSAVLATVLLIILLCFRSIMRIYYSAKEGVKWW